VVGPDRVDEVGHVLGLHVDVDECHEHGFLRPRSAATLPESD
jgi:hypothetical protein